jgi:hypothetical protein
MLKAKTDGTEEEPMTWNVGTYDVGDRGNDLQDDNEGALEEHEGMTHRIWQQISIGAEEERNPKRGKANENQRRMTSGRNTPLTGPNGRGYAERA